MRIGIIDDKMHNFSLKNLDKRNKELVKESDISTWRNLREKKNTSLIFHLTHKLVLSKAKHDVKAIGLLLA